MSESSSRTQTATRIWSKRLVWITTCFVLVTLVLRHYEEEEEEDVKRQIMNEALDGNVKGEGGRREGLRGFYLDRDDVRRSCREFFEPSGIMSLKDSSTVEDAEHGIVAADDERCSKMGLSILRDHNGNAVDAAVTTMLCLGVLNPASSGIGGGGFILIHSDQGRHNETSRSSFIDKRRKSSNTVEGEKVTEVIDCRETAPAASSEFMYESAADPADASLNGALSIAVPGELRGLELAHSRYGSLPWKEVVEPAMDLAYNGFKVSKHLAEDIKEHWHDIKRFQHIKEMLTKNGVTPLQEGDTLQRRDLARTFRSIIRDGADAVYKGHLAQQIATEVQNLGGILSVKDLASYKPTIRDPLIGHDINGFIIVGVPPPSSGGATVIAAARFLSGYAEPLSSQQDTLSKHRIVEALKHAFAMRMSLGDVDFDESGNVTRVVEDMLSGSYMEQLRKETLDGSVLPMSKYGGEKWALLNDGEGEHGELVDAKEGDRRRRRRRMDVVDQRHRRGRLFQYLEDQGTSHLSIIDKDHNSVAITSTVNNYFGSKILSPSTGILFNDQMDDFSTPGRTNYFGLAPSKVNYIQPHKKPLSSMSPTMIFRSNNNNNNQPTTTTTTTTQNLGQIVMSLGASGGPKIISSVLQVFINYSILGMPLYESISHPRLHDQLLYHGESATLYDESPLLQGSEIEVSNRTKDALERRGHRLLSADYLGTVQAVAVDLETGLLTGVSDIRKLGRPAGY